MPAKLSNLQDVFSNVLVSVLSLIGLVTFGMLLWGGVQYLTAGSDKEAAGRARNTITYALIGLILAISSVMIINLLGTFLGLDFSTFNICLPGTTSC